MFKNHIEKWLENALDYGITEREFWDMTIAELNRSIDSKKRIQLREAREQASYDYILADLIGRSVARLYSSSNEIPSIEEIYPTLFDSEEIKQEKQSKKNELSILRFKEFANAYNSKFKGDSE